MGWGWAIFVVVWSIVFTGTVDNLARPLFMRGSTDIHPLLVFLSVFGGMYWMGIPGVLVGPVIVAFFLALYTIYLQDFLGFSDSEEDDDTPGMLSNWMAKLKGLFDKRPAAETAESIHRDEPQSETD